jgi:hypothetical protein
MCVNDPSKPETFGCECEEGYQEPAFQLTTNGKWFCAATAVPTAAPTYVPSAQPTETPTNMPTEHPCDDGSHGCDTGTTMCGDSGDGTSHCVCLEGFTNMNEAGTTCRATAAPTAEPTFSPTHEPTLHACVGGTHDCDDDTTVCVTDETKENSFTCDCAEGFVGPAELNENHNWACAATESPTLEPTNMPTDHACDDGSHGCDTASTMCGMVEGRRLGSGSGSGSGGGGGGGGGGSDHEHECVCLEGFENLNDAGTACTAIPPPPPPPGPSPEIAAEAEAEAAAQAAIAAPTALVGDGSGVPAAAAAASAGPPSEPAELHSLSMNPDSGEGPAFAVGDTLKIGVGVADWQVPATVEVTSVGTSGEVLSVNIVDGGVFVGTDRSGTYNLTPADHALLLMAKQEGKQKKIETPSSLALAGAAAAFLALFAVVVVKRHQLTGAFTPTPANMNLSEMALTPSTSTALGELL